MNLHLCCNRIKDNLFLFAYPLELSAADQLLQANLRTSQELNQLNPRGFSPLVEEANASLNQEHNPTAFPKKYL